MKKVKVIEKKITIRGIVKEISIGTNGLAEQYFTLQFIEVVDNPSEVAEIPLKKGDFIVVETYGKHFIRPGHELELEGHLIYLFYEKRNVKTLKFIAYKSFNETLQFSFDY
ncbi:MAG: hypothetical protein EAX96_20670 [Candidatus Lokiarchaeota archaeon]|nr:hypothetical protein [Candidatus Lokiarchaeota archaeon]